MIQTQNYTKEDSDFCSGIIKDNYSSDTHMQESIKKCLIRWKKNIKMLLKKWKNIYYVLDMGRMIKKDNFNYRWALPKSVNGRMKAITERKEEMENGN